MSLPRTTFAQDGEIAHSKLQETLDAVEFGEKAKAELRTLFLAHQNVLEKKQKALDVLGKKLNDKGMPWSDEKRRQANVDYQKQLQELRELQKLQKLYGELQEALKKADATATQTIFGEMRSVLNMISGNTPVLFEFSIGNTF